ncbi:MAG: GNAT family N-acetyltransferase [Pyrinomonadaceae bacterium]|nr:GNAT family N-acetyltransferase [Pyrinomonadaceae bacterium]
MNISIRNIEKEDNQAIAKIIRNTLEEFDSAVPGTVYFDASTDHLFELFQHDRSVYFVAFVDEKLVGGSGIFPTDGLPPKVCELVKLYLSPEARGIGLGIRLIQKCFETAKEMGYEKIYLETREKMKMAVPLYEKLGFAYLEKPLANSGHHSTNIWMIKDL